MTTIIKTTVCVEHNPCYSAISEYADTQFTFCQDCEQKIDRFWLDYGLERMSEWSDWAVTN